MKRGRRCPGKENESPRSMSKEDIVATGLSLNSPIDKKVRILTPLEESVSFQKQSSNYIPNKNMTILSGGKTLLLNSTGDVFKDNYMEGTENLGLKVIFFLYLFL